MGLLWCGKQCQAEREAERKLEQAKWDAVKQASNTTIEDNSWSAMQTTGVILGSLIGITLMVVVIKKVAKARRK